MQVDQFGVEVKQVVETFVAPALRVFKVVVLTNDGGEVEIYVSSHMHSINNPQGHAVFSDLGADGNYSNHRTIHANVWRDVQEMGIIAGGRETVN